MVTPFCFVVTTQSSFIGELAMPAFVALVDYTTKGVKKLRESPERADEFVKWAESQGVVVKELYWTMGKHDGILIVEAPDELSATSAFLKLAAGGHVRTQTMRAYDRAEFASCLPK
jgi:uncharacterized protein with GYD domain